jgi:serine/threonine-protein kinase
MARACSSCGKQYTDDVTFCLDDGTPLVAQAVAVANTMMAGPGTAPAHPPNPQTAQGGPITASAAAPAFEEPQLLELTEGTVVGEYVVEKQIGEGGMGVIFSAKHPIIGKRVAIKVLNPDMASNASVVQRFIQEARSVNQIGNRNIVDIFSFGRLTDGRHYFVMEYLDGMPFSKRIHESMVWPDAMAIWLQMCSAVDAAHQRGIVHRDLKPDNIFVIPGAEGPFVKVLDFGIAKLMGGETGVQKTSTGVPMGTPLYMSPEQTRGGAVDHRTDIYATGIILYETVTGETPFNAPSFFEVMSKQLTEAPPPFTDNVTIDRDLETLIFQCLEKEPLQRPQTMGEVRDRLLALRDAAMKSGQPLFERQGQPWDRKSDGSLPPGAPTHKDDATDRQRQSPRRVDAAYTVPDPRDSKDMPIVAPQLPVAAPKSKAPLLVGVIGGIALLGGVGYVALNKKEPPKQIVTPPANVAVTAPPPITPEAEKPGKLLLNTGESGVTVTLDDTEPQVGGPGFTLIAKAGLHKLKVTKPNFLPFSKDVVFVAGDAVGENVKLEPEKVAKPPSGHREKPAQVATPTATPHEKPPVTKDGTINPFGN